MVACVRVCVRSRLLSAGGCGAARVGGAWRNSGRRGGGDRAPWRPPRLLRQPVPARRRGEGRRFPTAAEEATAARPPARPPRGPRRRRRRHGRDHQEADPEAPVPVRESVTPRTPALPEPPIAQAALARPGGRLQLSPAVVRAAPARSPPPRRRRRRLLPTRGSPGSFLVPTRTEPSRAPRFL